MSPDAQYIDLIVADKGNLEAAFGGPIACLSNSPDITSPACTASIAALVQARQKFQDDLAHARPPRRLEAMHDRLWQDLAALEFADKEASRVAASGDQAAFDKFARSVWDPALLKVTDDAFQLDLCGRTQDPAYFQRKCT